MHFNLLRQNFAQSVPPICSNFDIRTNRIGGVMASVPVACVVDRGFKP